MGAAELKRVKTKREGNDVLWVKCEAAPYGWVELPPESERDPRTITLHHIIEDLTVRALKKEEAALAEML